MAISSVDLLSRDTAADSIIRARLLGDFEIWAGNRQLSIEKRKACAILAYLLLGSKSRETRARLCALLWSDSDEDHARQSLRQSLRDLRQIEAAAGARFLLTDRLSVGINLAAFQSDFDTLRAALDKNAFSDLSLLLSRFDGGLCTALQDCDPVFDNWLAMTGANWSDRTVARLSKMLDQPSLMQAERKLVAECILQIDRFHETAMAQIIEAAASEGGYPSALASFERYRAELREELDLPPPGRIIRLLERIKGTDEGMSATIPVRVVDFARAATGPVDRPTIVIVTEKDPKADSHILFALVSELSASLSRFRHWTVVQTELTRADASATPYENFLEKVGRDIDLVLFVGKQSGGTDETFSIRCQEALTGKERFSLTAPCEPAGWKAIFNNVSAQAASRLELAISTTRLHRIEETSKNFVSAYDSWLDGQRLSIMWHRDTEAAAIERYEEALRQDPHLAIAYSSLAAVLNSRWIVVPGYPVDGADLDRAFELVKKAVTLDPLDHRNQVNLAWSHLLARRWELAEFHFGLAHELNAANPATLIASALAFAFMGQHERAVALSRRSAELNPLHQPHYDGYQATIAFLAGDMRGCIDAVEKCDGLFPDIRGWSAAAHAILGNRSNAAADYRAFLAAVSAAWYEGGRPSQQEIVKWFVNVFPLRFDDERRRLADGITRAASWS